MRNLILFFVRNYYTLLFLALESLSVFLVIRNNHFHRAHFLNSSNAVSGEIYAAYSGVTDYFRLSEKNEKLAKENTWLRNQLQQSVALQNLDSVIVKDSLLEQQYIYINAKAVNNSTHRRKNYLTLNAGTRQGIKPEMAVFNSEGIVGVVRDVSENFCSVMSVLHENTRIPVTIKRFNENTILFWHENNDQWHATLERVPSHLSFAKGDTVVTSAYSSIFPEGIMAGTIEEYKKISGDTFYQVTIKLSTRFSRVSYVYVVKNLMKEEQDNLERKMQQ